MSCGVLHENHFRIEIASSSHTFAIGSKVWPATQSWVRHPTCCLPREHRIAGPGQRDRFAPCFPSGSVGSEARG